MIPRSLALAVLLVLGARTVRADERELYTLLQISPQILHFTEPTTGQGSSTLSGMGGSLVLYYGLSDTIHVGGALHYATTSNASFTPVRVTLPDGASSTGAVYADARSIAATGVAAFHYDTGRHLAPLIQLEAGFASISYRNVSHMPSGAAYAVTLPDTTESALDLRASVRLEYRFVQHFVAGVGPAFVWNPGTHNPWALLVPITIGWIW